jgi:hypothetical protein
MNTSFKVIATVALVILALTMAVAAPNSGSVEVKSPIQVNGNKLDAGLYKITYTVNGDKADVVFKSGKNEVKTTAKIEESKAKAANTAISRTADGKLTQIWFAGRTTSLVFAD